MEINPGDHKAWFYKGLVLYHLKEYAKAGGDFEKSLKLNFDNNFGALKYEGLSCYQLHELKKALEFFNKYIQLHLADTDMKWNSDDVEILNYKGLALTKLKKYGEAEKAFEKALSVEGGLEIDEIDKKKYSTEILCNKGDLYLEWGKLEKAKEVFGEAIKLDNKCDEAWCKKGLSLMKEQKLIE